MPVDSVNGINNYQISSASGSQHRKQSQRDRSGDDKNDSSREEEKKTDSPAEPTQSGRELGQILDTSKVVELLNHRPHTPTSQAKSKGSYRPKKPSP